MALITKLEKRTLQRYSNHTTVDASYSVVDHGSGPTLLQIDTFGSESRKLKGKTSQSIQIDKKAAKQLMGILAKTFDL